MNEFELIQRFFTPDNGHDSVRLGVGDDGAVMVPETGRDLVTVVDTLVESIHYPADLMPREVGYRAVAVNLSDIAAMGARPRWMTLALTVPEANEGWLEGFAAGLFEAASEHGVVLIGGDTTRGAQTVITVQITGDVAKSRALHRSGALVGDDIYVTGTIGDAKAWLDSREDDDIDDAVRFYFRRRFAGPDARVELGQALPGIASAAIDISDGLHTDLQKLLAASGAGGDIEIDALPISKALGSIHEPADASMLALGAGDDYELCFTAPPNRADDIAILAVQYDVPITRIGSVTDADELRCLRDGQPVAVEERGYVHF